MPRSVPLALLPLLATCGPAHPTTTVTPKPPPDAAPVDAPAVAAPDPAPPEFRLPAGIRPSAYALALDLDADKETFAGHVEITLDVDAPAPYVWLDIENISIGKATVRTAGGEAELRTLSTSTDARVGFAGAAPFADGDVIAIDYKGQVGTRQFSGLFRQEDHQKWHLYSQFEAMGARRAFPCFDEPGFKVPWQVAITAPAAQHAYSNGPELSAEATADGKVTHRFAETPAIPSYLVAVAVGPFEEIDAGKVGRNQIPARILTPAGRADEAATAAAEIPKIVVALEDYFDMPMPFDKVDTIAIPTFFGAMENPGLVTYEDSIILAPADRVDDEFRDRLVAVAGHELAHQWFGNYVTLAWWDDVWLNESFATWMAGKVAASLQPSFDPADERLAGAGRAMYADGRLGTSPLHRTIGTLGDIEGAFDAIAYEKGGAVLAMFEHWIGEAAFRDGVRAYMKAHARGNATSDDFLTALASASTPELAATFRTYLDQAGLPVVSLALDCPAGGAPALHLHQERLVGYGEQPTGELWPVRACVRWGGKGGKAAGEQCVDFAEADATVELAGACPTWVIGNAGGAGYYRTAYDDDLRARLGKQLRKVDRVDRISLIGDQVALLGAGKLDAGDALALVDPLLATRNARDRSSAVELIVATERMVDDDLLPAWRAWAIRKLGKAARKAPLVPPKKESAEARDAREDLLLLVGARARDKKLVAAARKKVDAWLADAKAAPPPGLNVWIAIAASAGDTGLFDALLERLRVTEEPRDRGVIAAGLGRFTDPALIARGDELLITGELDLFQAGELIQAQLESPEGARAVGAFIRDKWDTMVGLLPSLALHYLVQMQGAVCDQASRDEVATFMSTRTDQIPNGGPLVAEVVAQIDGCIARRAAVRSQLEPLLRK